MSTDTDDEKRWLITIADEGLSKCTRFMLSLNEETIIAIIIAKIIITQ